MNQIICGDCLEVMKNIPDESIDMILSDLPYEITSRNLWDQKIPLEPLWKEFKRITKNNSAIVLTATNPFASELIMSNLKMFKYDLIWSKNKSSGFLNAKKMPLRSHELILVFAKKSPKYNPQKTSGHEPVHAFTKTVDSLCYGKVQPKISGGGSTERYPVSVLNFPVLNNDSPDRYHPTQKPSQLFEYLIKTYSDEGDLVLDATAGVGTTALAALKTGRKYICIEKDEKFFKIMEKRINGNI